MHFGVVLCPVPSHFKVLGSVCSVLKKRGHKITVYEIPEAKQMVLNSGFEYAEWGRDCGSEISHSLLMKTMSGIVDMAKNREIMSTYYLNRLKAGLQEVPALMKRDGVECIVADQANLEAGTIAEMLGIPFATICCSVLQQQELLVPPMCTSLPYDRSVTGILKNALAYRQLNASYYAPRLRALNQFRRERRMRPIQLNDCWSQTALICQQPREFDFPRRNARSGLQYVGPLDDKSLRRPIDFPWHQLNGAPLVYVAMGTIFTRAWDRFVQIAEACAQLPVQLVISSGGTDPKEMPPLPGAPLVLQYVPQLKILEKASLFITHGGLNSTQEALQAGVPLLVLPVNLDQFGSAARVKYVGAGEFLDPEDANRESITSRIRMLLDPANDYKARAMAMSRAYKSCTGQEGAADLIERMLKAG